MTEKFKTIVGLEIHVQLDTKSKMFCDCDNDSETTKPNTNVCPVCLGHPGTLPMPNKIALEWASKLASALNCELLDTVKFDRKNYFYPDLPKGYQISQLDKPIGKQGFLEINSRKIRINRLHLEEDAAKLLHDEKDKSYSLVDFNRGGTPLVEVVTEPDISSAKEAGDFLRELRLIIRYLGVSKADMEKGHLRCDANVSVNFKNKSGKEIQSTITEVKNLNSFKAVEKAVNSESIRLYEEHKDLEESPKLTKITAHWDDTLQKAKKSRDKEEAADYRYFPEPDVPEIDMTSLSSSKQTELPADRRQRFGQEYGLNDKDIEVLVGNMKLSDYFEATVSELGEWSKQGKNLPARVANWLLSELQKILKQEKTLIDEVKITPENFAEFIKIVDKGTVNSSSAQVLLREMFETGGDPSQIIEDKDLAQVNDDSLLESTANEVIKEQEAIVKDIKNGKESALQFLMGQMMAKTGGKINPQDAMKVLRSKIL